MFFDGFNAKEVREFILTFALFFPLTYIVDKIIGKVTNLLVDGFECPGRKISNVNRSFFSFTILHLLIVPLLNGSITDWLWMFLTYTHGLAHIYYPALYGEVVNQNYEPIYDYMVHAAQCLCVWSYHPEYFPLGVMIHSSMLLGAIIAQLDKKFLETILWLVVSGGGVFGTHYHMMLLNTDKNPNVYFAGLIIWVTPYLGYLYMRYIPKWDSILNFIGLFRLWYFHYFIIARFIFPIADTIFNMTLLY